MYQHLCCFLPHLHPTSVNFPSLQLLFDLLLVAIQHRCIPNAPNVSINIEMITSSIAHWSHWMTYFLTAAKMKTGTESPIAISCLLVGFLLMSVYLFLFLFLFVLLLGSRYFFSFFLVVIISLWFGLFVCGEQEPLWKGSARSTARQLSFQMTAPKTN